jgi:murein L,D-transpeptidase YafK
MNRQLCLAYLFLLCLLATVGRSQGALAGPQVTPAWILVDSNTLTLTVMQGEDILQTYENVAIGSNGVTWNKRQGDEKTPLGDFHIIEIRQSERFQVFIAIDYPTLPHATRALEGKRLAPAEYRAIRDAWARGGPPPQDTSLGGHIGIHGIGAGNAAIHSSFNWTDGCVALSNEQLEQLLGQIRVGMKVRIR